MGIIQNLRCSTLGVSGVKRKVSHLQGRYGVAVLHFQQPIKKLKPVNFISTKALHQELIILTLVCINPAIFKSDNRIADSRLSPFQNKSKRPNFSCCYAYVIKVSTENI